MMTTQDHIDKAINAHKFVLDYRKLVIENREDPMMHSLVLNKMRDCVDDIVIQFLTAINSLMDEHVRVSVNLSDEQKYIARHVNVVLKEN